MGNNIKLLLIFFFSLFTILSIFLLVYINLDKRIIMPVKGAIKADYSQNSFGAPRIGHTHKGVDIFAKKGTEVNSVTRGVVIYKGILKLGGKVVLILGPNYKLYYYAHLDSIMTNKLSLIEPGEQIGKVGNTGNAKFTPSHLHFSIRNFFPYKMGKYEDPVPILNKTF
jgi:murein DD-endopeptidase MepM/ murein hydrolase activator NlpD